MRPSSISHIIIRFSALLMHQYGLHKQGNIHLVTCVKITKVRHEPVLVASGLMLIYTRSD